MPRGHRRTGLCPTFAQPSLQRDGLLVRVPLIGGALRVEQIAVLSDVAARFGTGVVELTNRGNLQLRGFGAEPLDAALRRCRDVGLGDAAASLVTISPFADPAEHRLRAQLVEALGGVEGLSAKFVVHVDDAERSTRQRLADAILTLSGSGKCEIALHNAAKACLEPNDALHLVNTLARQAAALGPFARVPDVVAATGLPTSCAWEPPDQPGRAERTPLGVNSRAGTPLAAAGARLGRLSAAQFAALGDLLARSQVPEVRVTPWRSLVFFCSDADQARTIVLEAAQLGLITDPHDPAAGVITCIGSRGCWQTELDTFAEAERLLTDWPIDIEPGAAVHISGCDKSCATRAPVARTRMGRPDSSGFDTQ